MQPIILQAYTVNIDRNSSNFTYFEVIFRINRHYLLRFFGLYHPWYFLILKSSSFRARAFIVYY